MAEPLKKPLPARRMLPLDYLALAGGIMNVLVIGLVIGYWLFN